MGKHREVVEGARHAMPIAYGPTHLEGLEVHRAGMVEVAGAPGEIACRIQGVGAQWRRCSRGLGKSAFQPGASLGQVAAQLPEAPEGYGEAQGEGAVAVSERELEGRAEIVVLRLEPLQPFHLPRPLQVALRFLGHREKVACMLRRNLT